MSRHLFRLLPILLLLAACSESEEIALDVHADKASPVAPNILLIISDDIGMDVTTGMVDNQMEQYGPNGLDHPACQSIAGTPASTPVFDSFARQGMSFSNVWARPFCSPTRASILTGLYSATHVFTYADSLEEFPLVIPQTCDAYENGSWTPADESWHYCRLTEIVVTHSFM